MPRGRGVQLGGVTTTGAGVQTGGVTTTGAGAVTTGGVTTTGAGAVTTGGVTTTAGGGEMIVLTSRTMSVARPTPSLWCGGPPAETGRVIKARAPQTDRI